MSPKRRVPMLAREVLFMGASAWIATGWHVYRKHWGRVVLGALALFGFYLLLMALGGGLAFIMPFVTGPAGSVALEEDIPLWMLIALAILNLTVGVMLYLGYQYYLLRIVRGERPTIYDLLSPFRRPLAVIAVAVLYFLAVGLGLIFLVIPGIIAAMAFFFADIVLIDRKFAVIESFRGSSSLTRGYRGSLFLLYALFQVANAVLELLGRAVGRESLGAAIAVALVSNLVITPWSFTSLMCAYNDLLREAYSAEESEVEQSPPTPPV